MNTWKTIIRNWFTAIWTRAAPQQVDTRPAEHARQAERAQHQNDLARWVDEGGSGADPRRRTA